jgi:hypothetical protein
MNTRIVVIAALVFVTAGAFWWASMRAGLTAVNGLALVGGIAFVALFSIGIERASFRQYRELVAVANDGLGSLARETGLPIIDAGQVPSKRGHEAHFARLVGSYRGVQLSVTVGFAPWEDLATNVTLQWLRPMERSPKVSLEPLTALGCVTAEATQRTLVLHVSQPLRGHFWQWSLLSAHHRFPEADPARLRVVLDAATAFVTAASTASLS